MKILALAAQKGGSGKTTLAANLAVQLELDGDGPVALVDTDPQGSLADWWRERGSESPELTHTSTHHLARQIRKIRDGGAKHLIIDTPPAIKSSIAHVMSAADLVVIPTRPSAHDLRAVGKTVEIAERLGKEFVFVINGAHPRARITMEAVLALSEHGPVAPSIIHQRTDFAASAIDGRTVMEVTGRKRSSGEIAALWDYLRERLHGTKRTRRMTDRPTVAPAPSTVREAAA